MLNQRVCLPYGKIPQIPAILNSPPGLPSRQVGFARGRPRFAPLTGHRYSALSYKVAFALDFRLPGSPCIMSKKFAFGPVLNCSGEREELLFQYTTPGGGVAEVPRFVQPHNVLQVDRNASKGDIKAAFFRVANRTRRQERVMASLSYNILMSEIQRYRKISSETYEIHRVNDVVVLAAVGATAALLARVSRDKSLLTLTDEHKHTLLYLTARSGFYDTTEALLKIGVPVNERQVDGSTPLHAASFYGQRLVVELLLRYGADASITNKWGNTPADEAYSTELKQVILSHKEDLVSQIVHSLIGKGLVHRVRLVKSQGTVIGREVVRHPEAIDKWTRGMLDSITSSWVTVWHGTKSRHLESILRNGLKPSGSKLPDGTTIKPPRNHYGLGETHFGINNWANAIFLSPSIAYASHACYSERIFSDDKEWCILIKALVKPTAYTMHEPTVYRYDPIDGEPDTPEYRISATAEDKIFRVESSSNVVVMSVIFISLTFLENTPNLTFDKLKSLFDSKGEGGARKLRSGEGGSWVRSAAVKGAGPGREEGGSRIRSPGVNGAGTGREDNVNRNGKVLKAEELHNASSCNIL